MKYFTYQALQELEASGQRPAGFVAAMKRRASVLDRRGIHINEAQILDPNVKQILELQQRGGGCEGCGGGHDE